MSKNRRGQLYKTEGGLRGTCPVSKRTGVKLSFEHEIDGKKVFISKTAHAMLRNEARKKEKKA